MIDYFWLEYSVQFGFAIKGTSLYLVYRSILLKGLILIRKIVEMKVLIVYLKRYYKNNFFLEIRFFIN